MISCLTLSDLPATLNWVPSQQMEKAWGILGVVLDLLELYVEMIRCARLSLRKGIWAGSIYFRAVHIQMSVKAMRMGEISKGVCRAGDKELNSGHPTIKRPDRRTRKWDWEGETKRHKETGQSRCPGSQVKKLLEGWPTVCLKLFMGQERYVLRNDFVLPVWKSSVTTGRKRDVTGKEKLYCNAFSWNWIEGNRSIDHFFNEFRYRKGKNCACW